MRVGVVDGCFIHQNVKLITKNCTDILPVSRSRRDRRDCVCPHYGHHCDDCIKREDKVIFV